MNKLAEGLRQYRHNDSDGFVFGYNKEITERLFAELEQERDQLAAQNAEFHSLQERYFGDGMNTHIELKELVNKSPAACLAEIQAKAIENEIYYLKTVTISEKSFIGVTTAIDILTRRANQLRQQSTISE